MVWPNIDHIEHHTNDRASARSVLPKGTDLSVHDRAAEKKAEDGTNFTVDFDLTYRRIVPA